LFPEQGTGQPFDNFELYCIRGIIHFHLRNQNKKEKLISQHHATSRVVLQQPNPITTQANNFHMQDINETQFKQKLAFESEH
jgi:hypothetical protein